MKDHADKDDDDRQARMGLLARAAPGQVSALLDAALGPAGRPGFDWLRAPEIGSVMVRGRAGGTGAPFNLGEMTVTRCALTLEGGAVGHAYIQGRRKEDATAAALVDALMQTDAADTLRDKVLGPLRAEATQRRIARAQKAAATKVEFFTLVRGED